MKIKKGDILVSLGLLVLSFLMATFFSSFNTKNTGQYIRIEHNSKLVGEYSLDEDQEIVINEPGHYNKVVIKNGKAYMKEANCRDQICVHMKEINVDGETIVCLPNRVYIEVVDKSDNDGIDKVNRWEILEILQT